jgi:hypothetical protein
MHTIARFTKIRTFSVPGAYSRVSLIDSERRISLSQYIYTCLTNKPDLIPNMDDSTFMLLIQALNQYFDAIQYKDDIYEHDTPIAYLRHVYSETAKYSA